MYSLHIYAISVVLILFLRVSGSKVWPGVVSSRQLAAFGHQTVRCTLCVVSSLGVESCKSAPLNQFSVFGIAVAAGFK